MFNDKYGLTVAVLSGRKTQTRRVIECPKKCCGTEVYGFHAYRRVSTNVIEDICCYDDDERDIDGGQILPQYKVGEIVAIAQSYASIVDELENTKKFCCMEHLESASPERAHYVGYIEHPGFTNKMFVSSEEMPHQIRITNVRVERLQEISDEDVIKEGFRLESVNENMGNCLSHWEYSFFYEDKHGNPLWFSDKSAQEAFSRLIDKVCGTGTWESNPYVFVYDFELVK